MRVTRLVTLAWLFCHVGQWIISIFIVFSKLPGADRHCKTNVNYPTLTSKTTTLGWGTLGVAAGAEHRAVFHTLYPRRQPAVGFVVSSQVKLQIVVGETLGVAGR